MKIPLHSVSLLATDLNFLQKDVHSVAYSWSLNFIPFKCVVLRCQLGTTDWGAIGPPQKYNLNSSDIILVDKHMDLGVLVDNTLNFHAHNK